VHKLAQNNNNGMTELQSLRRKHSNPTNSTTDTAEMAIETRLAIIGGIMTMFFTPIVFIFAPSNR